MNMCVPVCLWCENTVSLIYIVKQFFRPLFIFIDHLVVLLLILYFPAVTFFPADLIFAAFPLIWSVSVIVYSICILRDVCHSSCLFYRLCQGVEPWRRAVWRGAAGWSERWWQTAERKGEPASSPESSHLVQRSRDRDLIYYFINNNLSESAKDIRGKQVITNMCLFNLIILKL